MHISSLTLFSNDLDNQARFYGEILGFDVERNGDSISIQIGTSQLNFKFSETAYTYHYCFLIPANQLQAGIAWLRERLTILAIEGDRIIQHFESWNADSVYFDDGDGSLAEFIVRYDLENGSNLPFGRESLLSLNEIGTPTTAIGAVNQRMKETVGSDFWKGDLTRFGTHGSQEGLLLLVNPEEKETWFPTGLPIQLSPYEAEVEQDGKSFQLRYAEGELEIG